MVPFMMLPSLSTLTIGEFAAKDEGEGGWLRIEGALDGEYVEEGVEDEDGTENDDDHMGREPSHPCLSNDLDSHITKAIKTSSGYTLPPKSSTVKHIDLVDSHVSSTALSRILRLPAALESFRYEVGGATVSCLSFIAADLMPGLLSQASSLRELAITTEEAGDLKEDEPVIGSLSGLYMLERLALPAVVLLGDPSQSLHSDRVVHRNLLDDLLPPHLITLELDLEAMWDLDQIVSVTGLPKTLPQTSKRIPSLRKIVIKGSYLAETQIREEVFGQLRHISSPIELVIE